MQYVQRKLHLSVTDTRTDLISRFHESRSGSTPTTLAQGFGLKSKRKIAAKRRPGRRISMSESDWEQEGGQSGGGGESGGGQEGGGGGQEGGGGGNGGMGGGGEEEGGEPA
jgi:hypothetical protein